MAFKCPFCKTISHNIHDKRQRYCGRCHVFVDDVLNASPVVRRSMARYCRRLAQKVPDNAEQLLREAALWEGPS